MGSWLRTHFHTFVYPAITALYEAQTKHNPNSYYDSPSVLSTDVVPGSIRFESEEIPNHFYPKLPPELRKLAWLYERLFIHSQKKSRTDHDLFRQFDTYGYLLAKVISKPWSKLDIVSVFTGGSASNYGGYRGGFHFDVLKEVLRSSEARRKSVGASRLLFAGRDVWTLHVMAQKRGIDSLFIPEISRRVADANSSLLISFLKSQGFTGDELLIDTGFVGSIPRAINEAFGNNFKLKFALMSQTDTRGKESESLESGWKSTNILKKEDYVSRSKPNQLFPQRIRARSEALATEYLPKYWASGTTREIDGEERVVQYLSKVEEFIQAAVLTSCVWRGFKYGIDHNGKQLLAPSKPSNRHEKTTTL